MLLSLVDILRCPADHEETALVLSVDAWRGQRVDRGLLGCPFCRARYPIGDGVIDFRTGGGEPAVVPEPVTPDEIARVRALLNLGDPGGVVLLSGRYAGAAESLSDEVDVTCLVVDGASRGEKCVGIMVGDRIPVADHSLRAAASDTTRQTPAFISELVRVVRARGRLLCDAGSEPSEGIAVLARDEQVWVGEVLDQPQVIPLRRP